MIVKVVVLALLAALAAGRITPAPCSAMIPCNIEEGSSTDCAGMGTACCNGYCTELYAPSNLRAVGQTCGSSNGCNGYCRVGACAAGRCQKFAMANSCPCSQNVMLNGPLTQSCIVGFCNSTAAYPNSVCIADNLPTAATCQRGSECASGSCVNGACQAEQQVNGFDPCTTGTSPYNFGCTIQGQLCIREPPAAIKCGSPITAGQCASDFDCSSFACNQTASPAVCVTRFSGKAGQPCSSSFACESHFCAPSGRCADPKKIHNQPDGAACPDGDFNCAPGLKCMGVNAPVCKRATGASCESDSSVCPSYSSPTSAPTQALYSPSNQANLFCGCTGGGSYCLSRPTTPQTCDDEYADMAVFFKVTQSGSFSSANPFFASTFEALFNHPWHLYPKFIREPMATYMCCALGPKGNYGVENLINSDEGQGMAYYLDCNEIDMLPLPAEKMTTACDPLKTLGAGDLFKGNVRWAARQN